MPWLKTRTIAFALAIAVSVAGFAPRFAFAQTFLTDNSPAVTQDGFIMSWLMLDQPILSGLGSTSAVTEDFIGDKAFLAPRAGDTTFVTTDETLRTWVSVNFDDLAELGEIPARVGGNELDIVTWGGSSVTNASQYLVTYMRWNSSQTVAFRFGSDDASESYFNGSLLHFKPTNSDWSDGNGGTETVQVVGGEWNALVVGAHESGGEWGISVNANPAPDLADNVGLMAFSDPGSLSTFEYSMSAGLNMFSPALIAAAIDDIDVATDGGVLSARHLIALGSTIVIALEGNEFKAAVAQNGRHRFGPDFAIQAGKGYVLNFEDATSFTMLGTPHGFSIGDAITAPARLSGQWAMGVAAEIEDVSLLPKGATLRVLNERTGASAETPIYGKTRLAAAMIDAGQRPVVGLGDLVQFELAMPDGYTLKRLGERRIGADDLRRASLTMRFAAAPSRARLLPNYPNPFNPETWIPFELGAASDVTVSVYDLSGGFVRRLDLGRRTAGYHVSPSEAAYWDGRNELGEQVSSGVYFYELRTGSRRDLRRMAIMK